MSAVLCHPWKVATSPRRLLAVRLQALGDVVITLPYLKALRERWPDASLDLLTRKETCDIPQVLTLFDRVIAIGGGRSFKRQWVATIALVPRLLARRYDAVLDLQGNKISRLVRRSLRPTAWSEFDRTSPNPAGERTRMTIDASGLGPIRFRPGLPLKDSSLGLGLLESAGWRNDASVVVLNPAGHDPTRNWPIENYVAFARAFSRRHSRPSQFLVLGLPQLRSRADMLRRELGSELIDLVGKTSPAEAFALVQRAALVLSEDSALMHMAWVSGIPTLALFGSSRGDWSRPLGERSLCLDSSDLECGYCMEPTCRFGDVHCLTRYDPSFVTERAFELLSRCA